jgi:hypothetical protein
VKKGSKTRGRNLPTQGCFASVGIGQANAELLREAMLVAALNEDAKPSATSPYGQCYIVDFQLIRQTRTVKIRSTWIVRTGEELPRLTSCFAL